MPSLKSTLEHFLVRSVIILVFPTEHLKSSIYFFFSIANFRNSRISTPLFGLLGDEKWSTNPQCHFLNIFDSDKLKKSTHYLWYFPTFFPLVVGWAKKKIETCRFHSKSSSENVGAVCNLSTKLCLSELCPIWAKLKIINSQFYYYVHDGRRHCRCDM